ncbi:winged helix-turn-helix domain-containing protein [Glaciecola sp. 1036]|uniref:winged helix-turn-helix domain-containing protein n=1 Tax=Alteromonadaceae TaxID=72275 RepID=UPI003D016C2D
MIYHLGNIQIDTLQFTVSVDGKAISVEPKVFDLIVYLINHRGLVITRDELFSQIWKDRSVSDTTLSNHIKSARKILGDDGELQKIIKTIRGRGYQFIGNVEEISTHTELQVNSQQSGFSGNIKSTKNWSSLDFSYLVYGIIICFLIGFLWFFSSTPTKRQNPHILVMPFEISSSDDQYWQPFADQMTREVIRKLSQVSSLKVVPATSAFSLNQQNNNRSIEENLPQVNLILTAVVNVAGDNKVRITTDLLEVDQQQFIWNKAYETAIDNTNFFSVQEDIARSVTNSLKLVLGQAEQHALSSFPTSNLAAYELYVNGQYEASKLNHEALIHAISLFDQAISLDPEFALAYLAKADAYRNIMAYFDTPAKILPEVIKAVEEALNHKVDTADALSSLGLAYAFAWRWEDAIQTLSAAKDLNPRLAQTELGLAIYYSGLGDTQNVVNSITLADKLDPLNVEIADWGHWILAVVGELEAAKQWSEEKTKLYPNVGMIFSGASMSASLRNEHSDAIRLAEQGILLDPESPYSYLALAQVYGYAGQPEKINDLLKRADTFDSYVCPYEKAINHILLDDIDQAFSDLQDAVDARSNCLVFTRQDPRLAPLRDDPRYLTLLKRIGLDDESILRYSKLN